VAGLLLCVLEPPTETTPEAQYALSNGYWLNGQKRRKNQPDTEMSNLPKSTSLKQLVYTAKMRWHIERDYQELKDELALNHCDGRNLRGFHRHATLCIAAYAYLVSQRIEESNGNKKTPLNAKNLLYPTITSPGVLRRSQRHVRDSIASLHWQITQAIAISITRCPCCAGYDTR